jgi:EAL domain-containing protein (putative c-di-GMP-specific phosphodiesterase class I)
VQAVLDLAAARHMKTTPEGVETEEQRRLLRSLGCTEMQDYLCSKARAARPRLGLSRHHTARTGGDISAESCYTIGFSGNAILV